MRRVSIQTLDQWERRDAQRQKMILRAGLLDQAGRLSFCLVTNVSATGMQIKLCTAPRTGDVVIRVADESPIAGQIIWVKKDSAGIHFDENIDPETFLRLQQKLSPAKRRTMPRVKAISYAALLADGRTIQAVLQDVSCTGARLTTSRSLEVGTRVSIRLPDLPEMSALVRWTQAPDSGIAFETPIPMQLISEWIEGRLRVAV